MITHSVFTHSSQPPVMILISSDVVAGGDQFVVHTGYIAADPGHLCADADRTLLNLRLQLYCLTERKRHGLNLKMDIKWYKDTFLNTCIIIKMRNLNMSHKTSQIPPWIEGT